jgi:hypothetical protein
MECGAYSVAIDYAEWNRRAPSGAARTERDTLSDEDVADELRRMGCDFWPLSTTDVMERVSEARARLAAPAPQEEKAVND